MRKKTSSGRRNVAAKSGEGPGATTRRRSIQGVGRNRERLYCGRCGQKKVMCTCPK